MLFSRFSLKDIKQSFEPFVKMALSVFILCSLFLTQTGHTQSEVEEDERTKETIRSMDLPEIEARQYEIGVIRTSGSGRVYLMEDRFQSKPRVGKVLLLKENILSAPTMAVRVIRVYEDKNQFAVKRIKRYGNIDALQPSRSLVAIEKIAELKPYQTLDDEELKDEAELDEIEHPEVKAAIATAKEQIKTDLKEAPKRQHLFSKELPSTKKFDSELDAEAKGDTRQEIEDTTDEAESYVARENGYLDPDRHLFGIDFASVANVNETGTSMFYSAAAFRYGFTFSRKSFFYGSNFQDSMTLEAMVYYYKAYNLNGVLDSYTLMPFSGILRQNFHLSESLTIFAYGGVLYNYVLGNLGGSDTTIQSLSGLRIAAGGGLLMKLGPRWNIRMNGGIDSICVGLALRF